MTNDATDPTGVTRENFERVARERDLSVEQMLELSRAIDARDSDAEGANRTARFFGRRMARTVFARRGNHSEAHLNEAELAELLAFAFECGMNRVTPVNVPL